jgi:hypothetical protein
MEIMMSRIPSQAMPHAYAPEGDETRDVEDGVYSGDAPTLSERAGAIADTIRGSRVAQVAAGAVVAGAVAAAATAVVRGRRSDASASSEGKAKGAKA